MNIINIFSILFSSQGLGSFSVLNWADCISPHKGYQNSALGTYHDQLSEGSTVPRVCSTGTRRKANAAWGPRDWPQSETLWLWWVGHIFSLLVYFDNCFLGLNCSIICLMGGLAFRAIGAPLGICVPGLVQKAADGMASTLPAAGLVLFSGGRLIRWVLDSCLPGNMAHSGPTWWPSMECLSFSMVSPKAYSTLGIKVSKTMGWTLGRIWFGNKACLRI